MGRSLCGIALVALLAACAAEELPPVDDGGGTAGDGGGGDGTGGAGGSGTGGSGTGGSGTGGSGGGQVDPLAACTAVGDQCNAGVCSFADIDCGVGADGFLAQCATGLCGMRDRDGNCPARPDVVAQCEREKLAGAASNAFWQCIQTNLACDDAFTQCRMAACNPND